MPGKCRESAVKVPGKSRKVLGKLLGKCWLGKCQESAEEMPEKVQGKYQECAGGKCPESAGEAPRKCWEGAGKVPGECQRVLGNCLGNSRGAPEGFMACHQMYQNGIFYAEKLQKMLHESCILGNEYIHVPP